MLARARPQIDAKALVESLRSASTRAPEEVVQTFEQSFISKPEQAAWAVNQGRAALLVALRSLSLRSTDEVVVPALLCRDVVQAVEDAGARPVLADVEIPNGNLDPEAARRVITPRTKAIVAAHLYGVPCQIERLRALADEKRCVLIEDCAHALGASRGQKPVGTFGDFAFYSFYFDKPLSTGRGGMLVSNRPELHAAVDRVLLGTQRTPIEREREILGALLVQYWLTARRRYRRYRPSDHADALMAQVSNIRHIALGGVAGAVDFDKEMSALAPDAFVLATAKRSFGERFVAKARRTLGLPSIARESASPTEMQMNFLRAATGSLGLSRYPAAAVERARKAALLTALLKRQSAFQLPDISGSEPAPIRYSLVARSDASREATSAALVAAGFECGNFNWPQPIHRTARYVASFRGVEGLERSEQMSSRLISLPLHEEVTDDDVQTMATVLLTRAA